MWLPVREWAQVVGPEQESQRRVVRLTYGWRWELQCPGEG